MQVKEPQNIASRQFNLNVPVERFVEAGREIAECGKLRCWDSCLVKLHIAQHRNFASIEVVVEACFPKSGIDRLALWNRRNSRVWGKLNVNLFFGCPGRLQQQILSSRCACRYG